MCMWDWAFYGEQLLVFCFLLLLSFPLLSFYSAYSYKLLSALPVSTDGPVKLASLPVCELLTFTHNYPHEHMTWVSRRSQWYCDSWRGGRGIKQVQSPFKVFFSVLQFRLQSPLTGSLLEGRASGLPKIWEILLCPVLGFSIQEGHVAAVCPIARVMGRLKRLSYEERLRELSLVAEDVTEGRNWCMGSSIWT